MAWFEAIGNMHMHTPYSDGEKYHEAIAEDAIKAGDVEQAADGLGPRPGAGLHASPVPDQAMPARAPPA